MSTIKWSWKENGTTEKKGKEIMQFNWVFWWIHYTGQSSIFWGDFLLDHIEIGKVMNLDVFI